ncbi:hypothetical protein EDB85DRAFT_1887182 [Lactarius pseudohatsudake]|nr:hypothetical protein EDB85DRAFT_1887182 [Lactarius pseudohatsudake]
MASSVHHCHIIPQAKLLRPCRVARAKGGGTGGAAEPTVLTSRRGEADLSWTLGSILLSLIYRESWFTGNKASAVNVLSLFASRSRRGESQSQVTVTGHVWATGYRKACTSQYKSQSGFTNHMRESRASLKVSLNSSLRNGTRDRDINPQLGMSFGIENGSLPLPKIVQFMNHETG